jgi:ribose transport system substrate-binding protein
MKPRAGIRIALALAIAVTMSACGSSDEDPGAAGGGAGGGGGEAVASEVVSQAEAAIAEARQPLSEFTGPDEGPGPVPAGKRVVIVTCLNAAPLCLNAAQGTQDAAEAIGWEAQIVDGGGTPAKWDKAVRTAITSKADAIVMSGSQPGLIPQAIAQAQSKEIPVVAIATCEDQPPPGVVYQIESLRKETGYVLGQWVVANNPDGAEVIFLNSPEFNCLQRAGAGFKEALADAGGSYRVVEEADSPANDPHTPQGVQRLAAMMRKHPNAKAAWVMSETWAPTFQQAAQQTSRSEMTGLAVDGDTFLQHIREGANFVMAGPATEQYGWWAIDGLLRVMNGKPTEKENIPYRLIDKENAGEVEGTGIAADYDFPAEWLELWQAK